MVFETSKVIKSALNAQDIRCEIGEGPDSSAVITGFDLKSGDAATIHFISAGERNDVALRVFHFAKGEAGRLQSVVNDLNCKFRYAKFTLRGDEVCLEMDVPQETTDLGKVALELLYRSLDIMEHAAGDLKAAGAKLEPQSAPHGEPEAPSELAPAPKKKFSLFGNGK